MISNIKLNCTQEKIDRSSCNKGAVSLIEVESYFGLDVYDKLKRCIRFFTYRVKI